MPGVVLWLPCWQKPLCLKYFGSLLVTQTITEMQIWWPRGWLKWLKKHSAFWSSKRFSWSRTRTKKTFPCHDLKEKANLKVWRQLLCRCTDTESTSAMPLVQKIADGADSWTAHPWAPFKAFLQFSTSVRCPQITTKLQLHCDDLWLHYFIHTANNTHLHIAQPRCLKDQFCL